MINECKTMARVLAKAITPMSLKETLVLPAKVESRYDWNAQETILTGAKFGTNNSTSAGTLSGTMNMTDDSNWDSYTD